LRGLAQWVRDAVGHHSFRVLQEHRPAGDHVHSGPQHPFEVTQGLDQAVVTHRGVDDAVGSGLQQAIGVTAGGDAELHVEPGEAAGVGADLVRVGHPDPGKL